MHKLTQHLFDPNVLKQTILESKFGGAQQKSIKTRFKTIDGCLAYLKPVTERQNEELKITPNKEKDEKKVKIL